MTTLHTRQRLPRQRAPWSDTLPLPDSPAARPGSAAQADEEPDEPDADPLRAARGVVYGVLVALLLWFALAVAAIILAMLLTWG
jgi:hypothetical protein